MLDFETGVQFGQALHMIKSHERRITKVEEEIVSLKALVIRGALVALLWGGGLLLNLPAEKIGEVGGSFLKSLQK